MFVFFSLNVPHFGLNVWPDDSFMQIDVVVVRESNKKNWQRL